MKRLFVLLLMLLALATVAYADLTPPLDANGEPIVINTLMPYGDGLLTHHHHGESIYLSDADDNWHAYPMRWENTDARDAAVAASIASMEELGMDTTMSHNPNYHFVVSGTGLLAVDERTGALYQVTFEDSHAVMTYVTLLDVLPDQETAGWLRMEGAFADEESLYLLTDIQDDKGRVVDSLYAFDLDSWTRTVIPKSNQAPDYLDYAQPWQDGRILVHATTSFSWEDAGTFLLDTTTGKMQTLREYFGLITVPDSYVYACDAEREIIILRANDLLYSVSGETGLIPFQRIKSYNDKLVFHPDGRTLRMSQTAIEEVDPLTELAITKLNVLTGGITAPNIQINSTIPDIQLATFERFATEETEMDVFANAMTTQSSEYDIFLLPIMQADSIIRKGYCVPMTSESAKSFVADMYPHMVKQLTNENGELVMVPVQLLRRKTIAYDMRAAELLGINPEDMPTTYEALFDFLRNFEYDYGDLAMEYDISLFETSTARNIGIIRQRMVEDAIALSRVDRKRLQANVKEIGKLLDDTLKLAKEVSDVVAPYFAIPQIFVSSSAEVPAHLDEPAFLFTLNTSALPSDHSEDSNPYRYLLYTQPYELALTTEISPMAIYSGYAMVVNPYSTKQEAALRYMDYVLENLDGVMAANVLTTAQPVESFFVDIYNGMKNSLELRIALGDTQDTVLMDILRGYVDFEEFLYDVPQSYLDTYQASVESTQAVWLDVKEAFAPCNAAWEQFLRGSIDGQQLLRRVLEVSQMIELE